MITADSLSSSEAREHGTADRPPTRADDPRAAHIPSDQVQARLRARTGSETGWVTNRIWRAGEASRNVDRPDGARSAYPVPQTKWDNREHLMRELGERLPTDEELARWQLTRREYEHFLDRHAAAR
jgi:hypothetical protein